MKPITLSICQRFHSQQAVKPVKPDAPGFGQVGTIGVFRTKGVFQCYLSSPSPGRWPFIKSKIRCALVACLPSSLIRLFMVGPRSFLFMQVNSFCSARLFMLI